MRQVYVVMGQTGQCDYTGMDYTVMAVEVREDVPHAEIKG